MCTLAALAFSNSVGSSQFLAPRDINVGIGIGDSEYSRSLKHWINDGLMTLFSFLIALELKRELTLGELGSPRLAAFPLIAAIGGNVVPVTVFLPIVDGGAGASGWGTVMSTDTAFVVGCLAVLGQRVPQSLRLFLLSLAIFDDVGAILIVAIGYGGSFNWIAIGVAAFGFVIVAGIARLGIRSIPV